MTHPHDRAGTAPGPSPTSAAAPTGDPPSDPSAGLKATRLHRLVLAVVPALVLILLTASAIWGDAGLLVRHDLRERLRRENEKLAEVERENQRIVHELTSMEKDPAVRERVVAEELGWARDGATLYRFDP